MPVSLYIYTYDIYTVIFVRMYKYCQVLMLQGTKLF